MREAGDRTTWTEPDATYEAAVHAAVDAAFDDDEVRAVLADLVARVAGPGWSNALSAKLLALTMPGIPDVYQGSELWEQSLVDPDNRRPVDFDARREVLASVLGGERPVLTAVGRRPRPRQAARHPGGVDAAPPPAAPVHDVRAGDGERRGGRAPARLRPWRRGHASPPGCPWVWPRGGWGDTVLHLPGGSVGRPAHRP